ncbi:hypothetical protein INS49_014229 [Diaporthe citri]|uniref:uncharacterized protein n=1 Tax=Diaporthe citri TaxID=83186 RepID=UPI001C804AF9|nr:uncharacterized protein INS49_014229 [Diaporthe citri]KAG6358345.1 hypothetical protein INS49_014229 [Diaporthe citri]
MAVIEPAAYWQRLSVSPPGALAVVAALLVLYIASTVIYRIYFHPLARFPGPFLGKCSELLIWRSILKADRNLMIDRLLKQYGSPLRLATNQLVFDDARSWVDIYGQSPNPCLKDPALWESFTAVGTVNVLNAVDRHYHARVRRLLSHNFSLKGILRFERLIADKIEDYMNLVFSPAADSGETMNVYLRVQEHYLDIISHLSFGTSFNCIKGENPNTLHDVDHFLTVVPATSLFPGIRYIPLPTLREGFRAVERLKTFGRTHVSNFIDRLEKTTADDAIAGGTSENSFLGNLVKSEDAETGTRLSFDELVDNAIIFLVAGSGTSAMTTTYFIWECTRNISVRDKLVQEIRTAFPDRNVFPTYEKASRLPLLASMIQETLRLWGPLNIATQRLSPGRVLGGHFVPKNVVVSTAAHTTARDPKVFPQPDVFMPERWIDATPYMRVMSRPFQTGPRNCVGRHLAEVALTMTLTRLFQLFDLEIDSGMPEEDMQLRDRGTMGPKGERLLVKVARAQSCD